MSDFIDKLLSVLESVFIAVLILVFVINPFIPPKIPILNNEKLREEIYKTRTCERFILNDPEKYEDVAPIKNHSLVWGCRLGVGVADACRREEQGKVEAC